MFLTQNTTGLAHITAAGAGYGSGYLVVGIPTFVDGVDIIRPLDFYFDISRLFTLISTIVL